MGGRRLLAVAASGLLAVALLAIVAWMVVRADAANPSGAVRIIPPAAPAMADMTQPVANGAAANDKTGAGKTGADAQPILEVYITGAVVNPGVYAVRPDQRVDDVLELAGGPTDAADLERFNLAARVTDAAHYRVPAAGERVEPAGPGTASVGPGMASVGPVTAWVGVDTGAVVAGDCTQPIDINTATASCLQTLPGIGPGRADAIIAHRQETGPFGTPDGITAVPGIGDGIYARIASLITVGVR